MGRCPACGYNLTEHDGTARKSILRQLQDLSKNGYGGTLRQNLDPIIKDIEALAVELDQQAKHPEVDYSPNNHTPATVRVRLAGTAPLPLQIGHRS